MKINNRIGICPKCGNESYIRQPSIRIFEGYLHVKNEYTFKCLDKKCGYESEILEEDTADGKWLKLPWWKRVFTNWE